MDYRKPLFDLVAHKYSVTFFFQEKNNCVDHTYCVHYGTHGMGKKNITLRDIKVLLACIRNADIVVSSLLDSYFSLACLVMCKLFRKKIIIWEEVAYFHNTLKGYLRLFYYRSISPLVDCFFVMGDQHVHALQQAGVSSSKIFRANEYPGYIYWQLKPHCVAGLPIRGKKIILYMGRFVASKGVDILIRAFAKLEKQRTDIALVLVGHGPMKQELLHLVHSLSVTSCRFMEPILNINQKSCLFKTATVLVAPSVILTDEFVEAGPMIVLEALSAGTPVIATIGEHIRYIVNGRNGFVVPPGNSDLLAEKIDDIIEWHSPDEIRQRIINEFNKIRNHDFQYEVLRSAIAYCIEK